ncbi:helix-turn-helix domain-containing protein [Sphingomonas melonis]
MNNDFFNQSELARRWRVSPRTLEGWRFSKRKVPYLKIGGRVLYRVADIERLERDSEVHPSQW